MHLQLIKQTSSGLLLPATSESDDFLRQIKIGEWIHADFKRVRNYAFHKRFFKLLQLGFDYWMPTGGAITPHEQELISGFVDFLCDSVGRAHTPILSDAAEQYLHKVAVRDMNQGAAATSYARTLLRQTGVRSILRVWNDYQPVQSVLVQYDDSMYLI